MENTTIELRKVISIYKIINNINGKVYIGQTIRSLEKRFQLHCQKSNPCIKIKNAIQKYGKENFTIELICETKEQEEADKLEIFWISYFDSTKSGYNIAVGGTNGVMTGRKHTEESKHKMSKAQSGEKSFMYGKHHTNETKLKISESHSGEKNHMYGKTGEKNPLFGKHLSEEMKKKISESLLGSNHPMYGKYFSKEHKQKISEANSGEKSYLFGKPAINRKLTLEVANKIREEYSTGVFSYRQLAKIYNINQSTISNIINNKTYTNN